MFKKTLTICGLLLFTIIASSPSVYAEQFGRIQAMKQRAGDIVKLRNDYVSQVLCSYNIIHERDAAGSVIRLNMEGKWFDVTGIDIVPLVKEADENRWQVVAHELCFYTTGGALSLVSELTIRKSN